MGRVARSSPGRAYPCAGRAQLELPEAWKPTLLTVVSTEEEFDWGAPFDSTRRSVEACANIGRGQAVFDALGLRPTYVVDHPVATGEISRRALVPILDAGRCEIGAHLHPWVNPPLEEVVGPQASFPGNLPRALERAKLVELRAAIERGFGVSPVTYQAGRYGFGPHTAELLEELGFEVDASASPAFDYSLEGGPDYSEFPPAPFWFGRERRLLAVPVSGAFLGFWRWSPARLHRMAHSAPLRDLRAPGLLARTGAVERVRLSPEGFDFSTLERLTHTLLERGVKVLVLGMHSPSFLPGCTPYVRSESELASYLELCRRYYAFFLGRIGGRHLTASELRAELLRTTPQPQ